MLVAAALAFSWATSPAAPGEPLAGLERSVESALERWQAPGAAAAVVKDGEVAFIGGFGTEQLGRSEAVNEQTLFTLASTTKAFVAIALGMLVDEGRIAWDDPVVEHLPEFRVADPYVTRETTIRDLLAHRTGVEPADILWLRGFDTATGIRHMHHAEQAASFRSKWIYNNMLYVVAAEVVSRVAGMSFQSFVHERIFAPLGMRNSRFAGQDASGVNGAHLVEEGGVRASEPWRFETPLGAAGIESSAADMAQWIGMLLADGAFEGRQIVSPGIVAEALEPQMVLDEIAYPAAKQANPNFFAYGLGWFLQDYRGHLLAMHTGSLFGANALVALVPDLELGLVILINAGPVEYRHAFMYDVIDRYLGKSERDWSAELFDVYAELAGEQRAERAALLEDRPADAASSHPHAAYAGDYSNPLVGDVEVAADEDGGLRLLMPPNAVFDLTHWSYDTFEARGTRAPESERFHVTFGTGLDGGVSGFETDSGRRYARKPAPED